MTETYFVILIAFLTALLISFVGLVTGLVEVSDMITSYYIRYFVIEVFLHKRAWWGNSWQLGCDGNWGLDTPWFMVCLRRI